MQSEGGFIEAQPRSNLQLANVCSEGYKPWRWTLIILSCLLATYSLRAGKCLLLATAMLFLIWLHFVTKVSKEMADILQVSIFTIAHPPGKKQVVVSLCLLDARLSEIVRRKSLSSGCWELETSRGHASAQGGSVTNEVLKRSGGRATCHFLEDGSKATVAVIVFLGMRRPPYCN